MTEAYTRVNQLRPDIENALLKLEEVIKVKRQVEDSVPGTWHGFLVQVVAYRRLLFIEDDPDSKKRQENIIASLDSKEEWKNIVKESMLSVDIVRDKHKSYDPLDEYIGYIASLRSSVDDDDFWNKTVAEAILKGVGDSFWDYKAFRESVGDAWPICVEEIAKNSGLSESFEDKTQIDISRKSVSPRIWDAYVRWTIGTCDFDNRASVIEACRRVDKDGAGPNLWNEFTKIMKKDEWNKSTEIFIDYFKLTWDPAFQGCLCRLGVLGGDACRKPVYHWLGMPYNKWELEVEAPDWDKELSNWLDEKLHIDVVMLPAAQDRTTTCPLVLQRHGENKRDILPCQILQSKPDQEWLSAGLYIFKEGCRSGRVESPRVTDWSEKTTCVDCMQEVRPKDGKSLYEKQYKNLPPVVVDPESRFAELNAEQLCTVGCFNYLHQLKIS